MPFEFKKTEIEDVILITPKIFGDERGFFCETYKKSDFSKAGIDVEFSQDNHSKSTKGVLRGLHYQKPPYAQAKLVRCVKGAIFDVALDVRKNSKTFGKWVGEVLNEDNKNMLYIPEGFAHGFITLQDNTEVLYKTSGEYSPENDRGILWSDPKVGIGWNFDFEPILSEKDKKQPCLAEVKEEDLF